MEAGEGATASYMKGPAMARIGPGDPKSAGASLQTIADCAERGIPMLGVCLGHQALGELFGATVGHAPELMHGKTSVITHDGRGVFEGVPSPLTVTRYHSLTIDPATMPDELEVSAATEPALMRIGAVLRRGPHCMRARPTREAGKPALMRIGCDDADRL